MFRSTLSHGKKQATETTSRLLYCRFAYLFETWLQFVQATFLRHVISWRACLQDWRGYFTERSQLQKEMNSQKNVSSNHVTVCIHAHVYLLRYMYIHTSPPESTLVLS